MSDSNHKRERVRITVTLDRDAYERIKHISRRVGLLPATWVSMVATSKANNDEVETDRGGE